jgi:type II restriction/modification system DNA methylase subunit YeeA
VNYNSSEEKEREFYNQENTFVVNEQDDFLKIPGNPIAYWARGKTYNSFQSGIPLEKISDIKVGLQTGNNDIFVRMWSEVCLTKIGFGFESTDGAKDSKLKWFPFNKGGEFRKWFGNNEFIINWENNGFELKNFTGSVIRNENFYFKEGITWTLTSSTKFGVRYKTNGFIFDVNGMSLFPKENDIFYIISFMNSKICLELLKILNPTIAFQVGDISRLPIIFPISKDTKSQIKCLTQQNIEISREEWDSRESSWDFRTNELLRHKTSRRIEDAYNNYCSYWKEQFFKLHANEEEMNRTFIDIYDLADELTPDVPLEDISILKDESEIKDGELVFKKETIIKQFISYAVGCMFGRYSPDKEGLILANQGESIDDFMEKIPDLSFMPDDDNIIPILEDEYFTDDIVSRFKQFLKATFGAESLAENLDFIAGALSKSKNGSKSPEKTIRDYFLKSFFKDHTRTYKKRPIYWLFTTGKGRGFNALVYMHRYDTTTLAKMRTDYLLELEAKLDARMDMLTSDSARDKQEREKLSAQIEELAAYDEVLNNKALRFIDIDLDDGVVVNYAKFEGLVGKI